MLTEEELRELSDREIIKYIIEFTGYNEITSVVYKMIN
jgi:hypothetical protein